MPGLWLLNLTLLIQSANDIRESGAKLIGEGLKVNSSLQWLRLVRLFGYCL